MKIDHLNWLRLSVCGPIWAFCLPLTLWGCGEAVIPPTDFTHQTSDLTVDPSIIYGKLPNGVRYAVLHNETPTKTAALRMRIATGSLNEAENERGVAHFLEHMAFNGSKNIPEGGMVKRLERHGLAFGADTNAYTSFDETVYTLDLPTVSDELIDETLMMMRETASNLTLGQDAIDRERGVVQSEKRTRDSAAARAGLANLEFFSRGSRLLSRIPIGTDETLKTMNADVFRTYYEGYYRPENTFIVLAGDIDTDIAVRKISEQFSDWQAQSPARDTKTAGETVIRGTDTGYFVDPEVQTSVTLAVMRPYVEEKDSKANRKKGFIDGLGMRIFNRRLSSLAQKADADFISGGAGQSGLYESVELTSLSLSSRPENWAKALAVGEQELRKALKFGFTQAELDEQLANSKNAMRVSAQKAETRSTYGLASSIVSSFAGEGVVTHPSTSLKRFGEYEDQITVEDVWARFKAQWFGGGGQSLDAPLLYLQTSEILETPKKTIEAAYHTSRAVVVEANKAVAIQQFAYTDFGKAGKVVSERHIKDLDAYLFEFDNHVLLNFKQTDFKKDQIQISISIGDGTLSAPYKSVALPSLAGSVMGAGGLLAHNADDIARLMAGKSVGAGMGFGAKSFSISGSTVPADLATQFNLMTAQITAAGYRPEAKARYDKYIESWYPTLDATPAGVASREIGKLLRSGDERYGIPSEATLLAPTIQAVKDWIEPQLQKGQIEISVVGDIDKDKVVQQVARTLGALPKRAKGHQKYPNMTKIRFPKGQKQAVRLSHSGDANRALLQVYWPAPDGTDIDRNRRLSVLRQILSNRLTDIIREEEAAAYSPSAGYSGSRLFKDYGYFSVSLGLKPEMVRAMIKRIDDIAEEFRLGQFDEDEFQRAIKPILESLDTSLESNGYWLSTISHASTDPWGVNAFRTRESTYQNMTVEDLKPLAAEIFRAKTALRVQIMPHE